MSKEPYDPMNMKALLCFERMARHSSLTQASIELGISDAAVSQRIKSLERSRDQALRGPGRKGATHRGGAPDQGACYAAIR